MTFKFIDGLPQLPFFVRASRFLTLRDALHSAKLGEAHGYRSRMTTTTPTQDPVQILSQRVQALEVKSVAYKNSYKTVNKSGKPNITCFKCSGPGHVKRSCNWNGDGDSQPNLVANYATRWGMQPLFVLSFRENIPKIERELSAVLIRCLDARRSGPLKYMFFD